MSLSFSSIEEAMAFARKDLSDRLGVRPEDISVVESKEATWPDTSLGMPEKGKMYAQVLTEGFLVILLARGMKYEYHFGNGFFRMR